MNFILGWIQTRWEDFLCWKFGHKWKTVQGGGYEPNPVDECQRCFNRTDGPL